MTRFFTVLALAGMTAAAPAWADNVCINTRDIVASHSEDGRTMVFKMRDGRTFINPLHGICSQLRFNGYGGVMHEGDTRVCENEQTLKVLQSGQVCTLGKFDPPQMSRGTY